MKVMEIIQSIPQGDNDMMTLTVWRTAGGTNAGCYTDDTGYVAYFPPGGITDTWVEIGSVDKARSIIEAAGYEIVGDFS